MKLSAADKLINKFKYYRGEYKINVNLNRDRILTKIVFDKCLHELEAPHIYTCKWCGITSVNKPNFMWDNDLFNYSTWDGFGLLWEGIWNIQNKFDPYKFYYEALCYLDPYLQGDVYIFESENIDPDIFGDKLYKWLEEHHPELIN